MTDKCLWSLCIGGRMGCLLSPCVLHLIYHGCGMHLTLMLLMANLASTNWCKSPQKWLKPWHMGTHLRVLCKSYPMNTNKTGFRWFSKIFAPLRFGRKYPQHWKGWSFERKGYVISPRQYSYYRNRRLLCSSALDNTTTLKETPTVIGTALNIV